MTKSLLALLFLVCVPHLAEAQTSSSITNADKRAAYERLKRLFIRDELKTTAKDLAGLKEFDLGTCESGRAYTSDRDKMTAAMMDLLNQLAEGWVLRHTKYPKDVWEPDLNAFEQARLNEIIVNNNLEGSYDAYKQLSAKIVQTLADFKRSSSIRLPAITWETDCGGHGVAIKIRSAPPGAKIFMISRLMREYCKDIGIDRDDVEKCEEWEELEIKDDVLVGGDKVLKAVWPSAVGIRTLPFKSLKNGATYTIQPR